MNSNGNEKKRPFPEDTSSQDIVNPKYQMLELIKSMDMKDEKLRQHRETLKSLNLIIEKLNKENRQKQIEYEKLQLEFQLEKDQRQYATVQVNSIKAKFKNISEHSDAIKEFLELGRKDYNTLNEAFKKAINVSQKKNEEHSSIVKDYKLQLSNAKQEFEQEKQLRTELTYSYNQNFNVIKQSLEGYKKSVLGLEDTVRNLQNKNDQYSTEIMEYRRDLSNLLQKDEKKDQIIFDMRTEFKIFFENNIQEKAELSKRIDESQRRIAELQNMLEDSKENFETQKRRLYDSLQEIEHMKGDAESLQNEFTMYKSEAAKQLDNLQLAKVENEINMTMLQRELNICKEERDNFQQIIQTNLEEYQNVKLTLENKIYELDKIAIENQNEADSKLKALQNNYENKIQDLILQKDKLSEETVRNMELLQNEYEKKIRDITLQKNQIAEEAERNMKSLQIEYEEKIQFMTLEKNKLVEETGCNMKLLQNEYEKKIQDISLQKNQIAEKAECNIKSLQNEYEEKIQDITLQKNKLVEETGCNVKSLQNEYEKKIQDMTLQKNQLVKEAECNMKSLRDEYEKIVQDMTLQKNKLAEESDYNMKSLQNEYDKKIHDLMLQTDQHTETISILKKNLSEKTEHINQSKIIEEELIKELGKTKEDLELQIELEKNLRKFMKENVCDTNIIDEIRKLKEKCNIQTEENNQLHCTIEKDRNNYQYCDKFQELLDSQKNHLQQPVMCHSYQDKSETPKENIVRIKKKLFNNDIYNFGISDAESNTSSPPKEISIVGKKKAAVPVKNTYVRKYQNKSPRNKK